MELPENAENAGISLGWEPVFPILGAGSAHSSGGLINWRAGTEVGQ